MSIKLKFIKDYAGHAKGKELKLEHQLASTLIKEGICEKVVEGEEVVNDSKGNEAPKKRGRKSSN